MTYFFSHLNLKSDASGSQTLDIDVDGTSATIAPGGTLDTITIPKLAVGSVADVQAKFAATDASIAAGVAGSAAASSLVQQNLDAYETSNDAALAQEVSDRTAAVSAEASARGVALTAETTARNTSIASVTAAVNVEKGRIDTLLAGSSVDLNTLIELTTAYENADTSILSTIATMQTTITNLQSQITALTSP